LQLVTLNDKHYPMVKNMLVPKVDPIVQTNICLV
jgi:hypothetical protein